MELPVNWIDESFAAEFASDWIAAWNARDLDRVLAHYTEDFEMTSPVIVRVMGEPSGCLKGKQAVGAYWAKALSQIPELHFEWIATLVGVNSVAIHYKGVKGRLVVEVFHFGPDRKVVKAASYYAG